MGLGDFLGGVAEGIGHGVGAVGGGIVHGAEAVGSGIAEHAADVGKFASGVVNPFSPWGPAAELRKKAFGGEDPLAPENLLEEGKGLAKGLYEGGKASYELSQMPRRVLQEAITHPMDIPEHLGSVVRTGQEVFNHRRQIADVGIEVGKKVIADQLDPKNIAINVALLAATGGGSALATAGEAGLEGVQAYRAGATAAEAFSTAKTAMTTAKAARTAVEGAEAVNVGERALQAGEEARRGGSFFSGATRSTQAGEAEGLGGYVERYGNKRASMMGDLRENLGMNRLSLAQRGRAWAGQQFAERVGTEGFLKETAGRMITGAPGAPETGGLAAESLYRGRSGMAAYKDIQRTRTAAKTYTPLLQVAEDPAGALTKFGVQEVKAHKAEIGEFATKHGGEFAAKHGDEAVEKYAKDKLLHRDEAKASKPVQQQQQQDTSFTPTSSWTAPTLSTGGVQPTRNTRQSSREYQELGTVQSNTMPTHIGPSKWYGPQGGYSAGRGFQHDDDPFNTYAGAY